MTTMFLDLGVVLPNGQHYLDVDQSNAKTGYIIKMPYSNNTPITVCVPEVPDVRTSMSRVKSITMLSRTHLGADLDTVSLYKSTTGGSSTELPCESALHTITVRLDDDKVVYIPLTISYKDVMMCEMQKVMYIECPPTHCKAPVSRKRLVDTEEFKPPTFVMLDVCCGKETISLKYEYPHAYEGWTIFMPRDKKLEGPITINVNSSDNVSVVTMVECRLHVKKEYTLFLKRNGKLDKNVAFKGAHDVKTLMVTHGESLEVTRIPFEFVFVKDEETCKPHTYMLMEMPDAKERQHAMDAAWWRDMLKTQ